MIFGKNKIIEAQIKEISDLKKQLVAADEKIESLEKELGEIKSKELAIAKAITTANLAAEDILAQAREESGKVKEKAEKELSDAQAQASSLTASASEKASLVMAEAEEKASTVVSEAESKGKDILAEAEAKSQKKIQDTEDEVRSYATILVRLNENMKEQAKLAQEASERYAAFYEQMSQSIPGIMNSIKGAQLTDATDIKERSCTGQENNENVMTVSDILTDGTEEESASTEDILNSI